MEAKTNAFFALRERLYAAAAAGCAVIKEDFRLQRAIEAFQPLSAANPVFGKLYGMCQKLAEAEQPALLLCDCIALADAVAVTQSRFQDDTPAELPEAIPSFTIKQGSWRQTQMAVNAIKKTEKYFLEYDFVRNALQDPRLLNAYLSSSHVRSYTANQISMTFERIYGKTLIPLLKNAINLKNPKSSGQQITYLQRLGGSSVDAFFKSLVLNTEAPQEVRLRAMRALAESDNALDYAEDLMTIYQTEKGKIKSTALKCLVFMNAPQTEPILTKAFIKKKDANDDLAAEGCLQPCMEYVTEQLKLFHAEKECHVRDYHSFYASFMLANKPEAADLFLLMTDFCGEGFQSGDHTLQVLNELLVENLCRHKDPAYHTLIRTLYEKKPAMFFKARLVVELLTDPENAFVLLENEAAARIEETLLVLNCIRQTADLNWRITPKFTYRADREDYSLVLFRTPPRSMLTFLSDCLRMRTQIEHDPEMHLCHFLEELLEKCDDEIRPAMEASVQKTALQILEKSRTPDTYFSLKCFSRAHGDPKKFLKRSILLAVEKHNQPFSYHAMTGWRSFVPADVVIEELRATAEILPERKLPELLMQKQLEAIKEAIEILSKED